ncbi:hypothetical protein [Streptomyces sp. NPDC056165]|uniref:hypothetical protein n=1 Tax=Streptomyces sp. NPDC056165 TaxID=3345733 RepID=UPI0035DBE253
MPAPCTPTTPAAPPAGASSAAPYGSPWPRWTVEPAADAKPILLSTRPQGGEADYLLPRNLDLAATLGDTAG